MPFAYYQRLSAARKRIYRDSDAIHEVPLPSRMDFEPRVARIREALAAERRAQVEAAGQDLLDALCAALRVPRLRLVVHAVRPSSHWGELHGLYEPLEGAPARVSVWMRTAQQKRVVAFRTFLRTLLHELCHHLDYELYRLAETFHTEGFYKRESSLLHQVLAEQEGKNR
ncbi:MAG TPA: hypothetical protein VLC55_05800 [Burkholderiales bacterium]|nr:hypothetical protein [Burkholderiales bacterium]